MTVIISGTDGVSDVDGTAGTPALRGTDANTGIFFPAADTIAFAEGGAEAMRINSDGQVGIGTTSPDMSLVVQASVGSQLKCIRTSGVTANFGSNSSQGFILVEGANPLAFYTDGGNERARITGDGYFKASNNGSYISSGAGSFHEFNNNADANTMIIGATNASLTTDSVLQIRAARNTTNNTFFFSSFFNTTAAVFKFRVADSGNVTNTNNSYGALSDVKLKQDIVDAGSQWDDIKALRVRKYRWKSDPDGFMQMGLVAQEAELVSPGLIDEHPDYEEVEVPVLDDEGNPVSNEDGTPQVTKERNALGTTTKAIKYSILYMKAVKALQEAIERIETLEASNTALEARIAALEAQ